MGPLPAGTYALTINYSPLPSGLVLPPLLADYPIIVSDGRAAKVMPWVRRNYSGHWWDPADPGWGLFVWQDGMDNLLAAWFTYAADGKPAWYVFQPAWQTSTATQTAALANAVRPPGLYSPPLGPGTATAAGTASLDFTLPLSEEFPAPYYTTIDQAKLIYQFNGGSTQTRTIKRFNGENPTKKSLGGRAFLSPANPTSTDYIKVSLPYTLCGGQYSANSHQVTMTGGAIEIKLGQSASPAIVPLCPTGPNEEIDLGRLPAGDYTISVRQSSNPRSFELAPVPFRVTDARAGKFAPFVRLDYSGQWWDPNDPGWGLFIWQDAASPNDSMLAAWFTYAADGKPSWYVFQPTWQTSTATKVAPMANVTRLAGAGSPPPTTGTPAVMGTASLDFTNLGGGDDAKITYTFTGGPTLTRTIKRFKP